jgi:hypothetical protein
MWHLDTLHLFPKEVNDHNASTTTTKKAKIYTQTIARNRKPRAEEKKRIEDAMILSSVLGCAKQALSIPLCKASPFVASPVVAAFNPGTRTPHAVDTTTPDEDFVDGQAE